MEENKIIFLDFARRAMQRIEEKKKTKKAKVRVRDIDMVLTLRGLSNKEIMECSEYSDDDLKNDYYTLYYACDELRELAKYMVDEQMLKEHCMVCEMFSIADRRTLVKKVMELSGINEKTSVEEIEEVSEIKNC